VDHFKVAIVTNIRMRLKFKVARTPQFAVLLYTVTTYINCAEHTIASVRALSANSNSAIYAVQIQAKEHTHTYSTGLIETVKLFFDNFNFQVYSITNCMHNIL